MPSTGIWRKQVSIYLLCAILAGIILLIDLSIPLGVAGGVPYISVILVSLWAPDSRSTMLFAVVCTLLTIAGYYFSPPGGEWWKVLFNRTLALFAIWTATVLGLQRTKLEQIRLIAIEEREEALREIKALKGLIPICAKCKKIRDDEGFWNQLESYIEKHSEASFSHGVCPECSDELYGKYEWYQKGKKENRY